MKERLDVMMVNRGLAESREKCKGDHHVRALSMWIT